MLKNADRDRSLRAAEEDHEEHEPPRGALLITVLYLILLTMLWMDVYLDLLSRGISLT